MLKRFVVGSLIMVFGIVAAKAQGPAAVISADGICNVGWFGCSADISIQLPDGSYTCPANEITLVFFQADFQGVIPDDTHGNLQARCDANIAFNQINPGGSFGGFTELVAVSRETTCQFLPDACQGNGAVIINPRTVGSLAVCATFGGPTTQMQQIVSASGQTSLTCSLPDPPQGE